jgi:hypothetical protein
MRRSVSRLLASCGKGRVQRRRGCSTQVAASGSPEVQSVDVTTSPTNIVRSVMATLEVDSTVSCEPQNGNDGWYAQKGTSERHGLIGTARLTADEQRPESSDGHLRDGGQCPSERFLTPTVVFRARAEARAALYKAGELDLHEAVDALQETAITSGLVDQIGQDAVQAIMAKAFERGCQ